MQPIIYFLDNTYYRMTTRPAVTGSRVVYEEKGYDKRYWQQSSEERFETAQRSGKRVSKVAGQIRKYGGRK